MNLEDWRNRIDEIDGKLVELLNQRAGLAVRVGKEKRRLGATLQDPEREDAVLGRARSMNHGPLSGKAIDAIYRSIIRGCTEVQTGDTSPAGEET